MFGAVARVAALPAARARGLETALGRRQVARRLPLSGVAVLLVALAGVALVFALLTVAVVVAVALQYDAGGGMQLTEQVTWIEAFGASYALGVDGLALTLLALTAGLVPVVMLASWHDADGPDTGSPRIYFALMLALEGLALGVFAATDVFLFYVFFEAMLIPAYFLIGGVGQGAGRRRAAVKFLMFSLGVGLIMLAAVIASPVMKPSANWRPMVPQ